MPAYAVSVHAWASLVLAAVGCSRYGHEHRETPSPPRVAAPQVPPGQGAAAAPALPFCAELERLNLAYADRYMKQRGKPFVIEQEPNRIDVKTGADLLRAWNPECKKVDNIYVGLKINKFSEDESPSDDEILRYWTVRFDVAVHTLGGPAGKEPVSCTYSPGWADADASSCGLRALGDLDGDGQSEILVATTSQSLDTGCCTDNQIAYQYEIYSYKGSALIRYDKIPTMKLYSDMEPFVDYDKDGRLDYWSFLSYEIPTPCYKQENKPVSPRFLVHGQPGGAFSRDDEAARAAARSWCPRPPERPIKSVPPGELAAHLICARLWGAAPARLNEQLARRCRRSPHGESTKSGDVSYDGLPWQFCYHEGSECDHPEMRDVCGEWVRQLVTVEPPFRFR